MDSVQHYEKLCDVMHRLSSHQVVCEEDLVMVGELEHQQSPFHKHLMKRLETFRHNPIFSMLDIDREKLEALLEAVWNENTAEVSFTSFCHNHIQPQMSCL